MGLINIGFLAGLLALAIPVIIHLLRNRRFRRADLGTLRFLRLALKESSQWRRLRELLILLTRLAIVLLLAYIFARPFILDKDDDMEKNMEALFLLDSSGSMSGKNLDQQNVDLAKELVRKQVDKLHRKTKITFANFADKVILAKDLKDKTIHVGGMTDYQQSLKWALDYMHNSQMPNRRIYLVTDMQRNGVPKKPLSDWPLELPVKILPVKAPSDWNAAISKVRNLTPFLRKTEDDKVADASLEIFIELFGEQLNRDVDLMIEIEGIPDKHIQRVPLRSGPVVFKWHSKGAGRYQGKVTLLSKDGYPSDNVYYFAFDIRNPQPVILVDGDKKQKRFNNETYFLEKVLKIANNKNEQSSFLPIVRTSLGDKLDGKNTIALCNVPSFNSAEIKALKKFVVNGGNIIYFLGLKCNTNNYAILQAQGLFPAKLINHRFKLDNHEFAFAKWDKKHPALQIFENDEIGNLARIKFNTSVRVTDLDEGCKVLANLADEGNSPAIFEKQLGKGNIMVVSNPSDRELTSWPAERLYLPLIQELFTYLALDIYYFKPINFIEQNSMESRKSGIYNGDKSLEVVNFNKVEADSRVLDEKLFREKLGVGDAPEDEELFQRHDLPENRQRDNEIWFYLLLAVLALMLLESFLSDRGEA